MRGEFRCLQGRGLRRVRYKDRDDALSYETGDVPYVWYPGHV